MPKNNKIRQVIMAALFFAAVIFLRETKLIDYFYIQSMCRKIYLPVTFWMIVMLYAVLSRPGMLKKSIILGFFANLYIALFGLVLQLSKDHSFLSFYYTYYIYAVLAAFTFLISFWAAIYIKRAADKKTSGAVSDAIFFAPLFALPFYLIPRSLTETGAMFTVCMEAAALLPILFTGNNVLSYLIDKARAFKGFILKKDLNIVVLIFVLSFVFRAVFAVNLVYKTETAGAHDFIMASDDGDTYDRVAREVVEEKGCNVRGNVKIWGGSWDEGYSIFLALLYKLFGRNFYVVTLVQAFLGSFLPVIMFYVGKLLFSRAAGIIAAIFLAMKSPMIFFSIVLNHEALWLPILALASLFLVRYYKSAGRPYLPVALAGILMGVVSIFRGLIMYLIPFAALWMLVFWARKNTARTIRGIILFIAAAAIVIYSASIIFDCPLSRGSKGRIEMLWVTYHLCDQFESAGNRALVDIDVNIAKDPLGSLANIARDPVKFMKVAGCIYPLRIFGYFESYQFGFFDPIYMVNSAKWPNDFMPTLEFYFTVFFLYGLFNCIKRPELLKSPIFIFITFGVLITAVIFCHLQIRQRAISMPFVYLIGSYGFVLILNRLGILIPAKESD